MPNHSQIILWKRLQIRGELPQRAFAAPKNPRIPSAKLDGLYLHCCNRCKGIPIGIRQRIQRPRCTDLFRYRCRADDNIV